MNEAHEVRITGLRYAYPGLSGWALDGIDLEIRAGEWLALFGANASGKTTLCRALVGLAPHLTGGRFQGQVLIGGKDTRQHPPSDLVGVVGLTFQNPESQLFNPSVETEIVWGLEALGLPRAVIAERLAWALHTFDLDDLRAQSPERLSGGQQRRLALAAVLAMQPSLLVLDAPLGGLDPQGRREVLTTLQQLREQRHITVVVAEADDPAVTWFADRVATLHRGRLVSIRPASNAREALAGADHAAMPAHDADAQPPSAPTSPHAEAAAIALEHLSFAYDSGQPVLQDLDLTIAAGEFVALVGANGSGKTTLAKHLIGLLRPSRGRLLIQGQDSARQSVGALARQVGFLFQNPERQIFSATVTDEIAFGPRNLGLPPDVVSRRVAQALARFDLTELASQPPAVLSFTQRRRVTLAAVAALETPILVLDEPTVGLDAEARAGLLAWLHERHAQGVTLVLVTHDLALVAGHAQRVLVLQNGRFAAEGSPDVVLREHALLSQAGLAAAAEQPDAL